jgi:hypothetical protein
MAGHSIHVLYLYLYICIYVHIYIYVYIYVYIYIAHSPPRIFMNKDKSWSNVRSFILWNGWWMNEMMVAKFRCSSLAYGGCVRDLDHRSMTSFLPRVTTIQQNSMRKSGSICGS